MKIEALREWRTLRRHRQLVIAAGVAAILAVVTAAVIAFILLRSHGAAGPTKSTRLPAATSTPSPLNLPPPDLLKPIARETLSALMGR